MSGAHITQIWKAAVSHTGWQRRHQLGGSGVPAFRPSRDGRFAMG
jgi:hypothetical protein